MRNKYIYIYFFFFSFGISVSAQGQLPVNHAVTENTGIVTGLIVLFLIALTAAGYFFMRYNALKKKQQQMELSLQALKTDLDVNRTLLNPHFIFNSLSALQHFILNKDHISANDHLVKFSKLIRKMLESNVSTLTSMELELGMIKSYLRFKDITIKETITEVVETDPAIDLAATYIPVMLVQPFIENAIWHGLLKKEGEKKLFVSYKLQNNNYILCVIDDNGIGRKKADEKMLEKKMPSTKFIRQRIQLLNKLHHLNCSLTIEDKPMQGGTTVKILLPILKNHDFTLDNN